MKTLDSWTTRDCADVELLRRCKADVRKVVPDADLVLYGSRARGDATDEYADYDMLVLVDGPARMSLYSRLLDVLYPIELETGAVFSFVVESRPEWSTPLHQAMPFHENVEREGVLV